jgi:serine/threonine protein kinase
MAVANERDLVGTVAVGRYRVTARIASGATGEVYEAEHVELGTHVALKVLRPEHADSEVAARFLREGKTLGLFRHQNIVELLEVGRLDDGSLFFATELVRGVSLRTLIEVGNVAPRRALSIMRQVLDALAHAHAIGVVHRDVRPENIMLASGEAQDLVKVLDFGVAKLFADTAAVLGENKLTKAGFTAFGDPRYIAPECVVGGTIDARADLYSVGAVLYEVLAGKPPFSDPDPSALMRLHAYSNVPPLAQSSTRKLTPEIELLVSEALAKKPELRYRSTAEMATAVETALHSLDLPSGSSIELVRDFQAGASSIAPLDELASPAFTRQPAPVLPAPPPSVREGIADARPAGPGRLDRIGALARRCLALAREHRVIVAASAAAVVLLVVSIVVLTGGDSRPGKARDPKQAPDLAKRANELLQAGNAKQAMELVETELAAVPKPTGDVLLVLGHARFGANRRLDALASYERAIAATPQLATDPMIRANVEAIVDGPNATAAVIALELLASRVSPPAHEKIITVAASGKLVEVRRRAFAITEREGLSDRVDLVGVFSLDLAAAQTCEDRRVVIAKLRATKDSRAVAPLKRARAYKCVERDANIAIGELEGTPAP